MIYAIKNPSLQLFDQEFKLRHSVKDAYIEKCTNNLKVCKKNHVYTSISDVEVFCFTPLLFLLFLFLMNELVAFRTDGHEVIHIK